MTLLCLLFISINMQAQIKGFTTTGEKRITVSVKDIITQSKIDDAKPNKLVVQKEHEVKRKPQQDPDALNTSRWPQTSEPQTEATKATQTIHSNFFGYYFKRRFFNPPR